MQCALVRRATTRGKRALLSARARRGPIIRAPRQRAQTLLSWRLERSDPPSRSQPWLGARRRRQRRGKQRKFRSFLDSPSARRRNTDTRCHRSAHPSTLPPPPPPPTTTTTTTQRTPSTTTCKRSGPLAFIRHPTRGSPSSCRTRTRPSAPSPCTDTGIARTASTRIGSAPLPSISAMGRATALVARAARRRTMRVST